MTADEARELTNHTGPDRHQVLVCLGLWEAAIRRSAKNKMFRAHESDIGQDSVDAEIWNRIPKNAKFEALLQLERDGYETTENETGTEVSWE